MRYGITPAASANLHFDKVEKNGTAKSNVEFVTLNIPRHLPHRLLYAYLYATTATTYLVGELVFSLNNSIESTLPLEVGTAAGAASYGRSFVSVLTNYSSSISGATPPSDALLLTVGQGILTGEPISSILIPLNLEIAADKVALNIKATAGTPNYRAFLACLSQV